MSSPSTVINDLLDAREKLDKACDIIEHAMDYADYDTRRELERIRKKIIGIKLQIDYVIDRYIR